VKLTRRELLASLGALAGGAVLAACGDDGSMHAPNCTEFGTAVDISANHGHVLVVSKADVMARSEKVYDIRGTAAHTHSVTITAAQFQALELNMTDAMSVTTVVDAHTHTVVVMCA
jgi:hypothetical protein